MARIVLINGPNLNLLGKREPDHYGKTTLAGIVQKLTSAAGEAGHRLTAVQSNAEHELIDAVHQAGAEGAGFILINPAGLTHTSVALRDALLATAIPFIEIHLSNIYARESFRHKSLFSDIAVGTIGGLGALGYELGLRAAIAHLTE